MNIDNLEEGVSNPLRKKSLGKPLNIPSIENYSKLWKEYILNGDVQDPIDLDIKNKYLKFKEVFPDRANSWLDSQAKEAALMSRREKTSFYTKILEVEGIQVFLDGSVDAQFSQDAYRMRMLNHSLRKMLVDIRGILPNKKPKFVITNKHENRRFKNLHTPNPIGVYTDRIIFIDQYSVDNPDIFIHEYAHYVVDLIPTQTEPILKNSYDQLLDIYWKRAKKRKRSLQGEPSKTESMRETQKWREKISHKLGFPEYGLTNFDEFFAVMIENWKKLPNNAATYKFKSLVKDVLNRL
jgi:hypothetical protein